MNFQDFTHSSFLMLLMAQKYPTERRLSVATIAILKYHVSVLNHRSLMNKEECSLLLELVKLLLLSGISPRSIGIITPYKAQERRIREKLKELRE